MLWSLMDGCCPIREHLPSPLWSERMISAWVVRKPPHIRPIGDTGRSGMKHLGPETPQVVTRSDDSGLQHSVATSEEAQQRARRPGTEGVRHGEPVAHPVA